MFTSQVSQVEVSAFENRDEVSAFGNQTVEASAFGNEQVEIISSDKQVEVSILGNDEQLELTGFGGDGKVEFSAINLNDSSQSHSMGPDFEFDSFCKPCNEDEEVTPIKPCQVR